MTRQTAYWIAAFATLGLLSLLLYHDVRQVRRFQIGMEYSEVAALVAPQDSLHRYGIEFDTPPTETVMQTEPLYFLWIADEGTWLEFNHYKRLIRVQRAKWLGVNIPVILNKIASWVRLR